METITQSGLLAQGVLTSGEFPLSMSISESQGIPVERLQRQSLKPFDVQGRIVIPGVWYPLQRFTFTSTPRGLRAENQPGPTWPVISLDFALREDTGVYDLTSLKLRTCGDTVEEQLVATRVLYGLALNGEFEFIFHGTQERFAYRLDVQSGTTSELQSRAALYRKMAFIEHVYGVHFALPEHIPAEAVRYVDEIYRGLVEGEFEQRADGLKVEVDPRTIDLDKPPFRGIGSIESRQVNSIEMWGTKIDVGPIVSSVRYGELMRPQDLRRLRESRERAMPVEFRSLDYSIHVRFERSAALEPEQRRQRLQAFLSELRKLEPETVADSIEELLALPVSEELARRLAFGWLKIHDFPDGIAPQEPVEISNETWSVPLWLKYPKGQAAPIGDLHIDRRTGRITSDAEPTALLERAQREAQKLVHAS